MRSRGARERIAVLDDDGLGLSLDAPRPSLHLGRFGVAPQQDDGVAIARVQIAGASVLVAAQDERFLGGSVGANHADALRALLERAIDERPAAVVLLTASGGVRLHEANAAEAALARALRALYDARAAGVPILAIVVGDVFGGASIVACAADRVAMLSSARIGLSGPRVIESVHGKWELDADRAADVDSVFGANARAALGAVDLIADDTDAIRAWIRVAAANTLPFTDGVERTHAALGAALTTLPVQIVELRRRENFIETAAPRNAAFSAAFAHRLDSAMLAHVIDTAESHETIVIVEDSTGHEVSRAAEMCFISRHLAHHAAVLALLRSRGHRLIGWLAGTGHSAAFFVNALQADTLYAAPRSRVVAMEPSAIARVIGHDVATLIEDDPLLGQPVRHFAALGGVEAIVETEEFLRRVSAAAQR